MQPD
jgi:hypothetical protein